MFKRIISLYADHKKDVALVLSIIFIMSGVQLLGPYFLGRMTDAVIHEENKFRAIGLALLAFVFVAWNNFAAMVRQRCNLNRLWFPIQEYLRFKTLDGYLAFSIGQLKMTSTGLSREIINNGEQAMTRLANIFVTWFLPMCVRFVVISGILLYYYPTLGLIVLSGLSVYAFWQWFMEKKYTPRIKTMRDKNLASSKQRGEILVGSTLIKTYSKEEYMKEKYRKRYRDSIDSSKEMNFYISRWDGVISLIVDGTQTVALIAGICMVYDHKITFGYLMMVQVWWIQMCSMIKNIGEQYQPILTDISDARKFFELIDTLPAIQEIEKPVRLTSLYGCIQFKRVSFGYPNEKGETGKSVVKEVSLTIPPGERVAIVGPSGSGKTSLITLLLRGYDPDAGVIEIDGHNLRTLALKDYYEHIAVVDQAALMMDMSIRDNILLGARKPLSDEDICALCRLVELDMEEFEGGLDKCVGEFGNSVSGGQKQRIAIARALASNPRILILDEPTSSLDAIAEAKIRRAIEIASAGRTTITIAHRLCTVQYCDRIFLMENGRISAVGTHRELLKSSGLYMQLVEEQTIHI